MRSSGGSYRFRHALYQQVLYERLEPTRRARLHQRIGTRLEAGYGVQAGAIVAQLAVHFERGGEVRRAVHSWHQVGDTSARRNAYPEAMAALTKGLALLATLPESAERARHELTLQLALGALLLAMKGRTAPEVGEVYTRAHALGQQVGELQQCCQALWGLVQFHAALGHVRRAGALSQQLFQLTQQQPEPALVSEGHLALGHVLLY